MPRWELVPLDFYIFPLNLYSAVKVLRPMFYWTTVVLTLAALQLTLAALQLTLAALQLTLAARQ
jgi:hypothetical protein